MKPSRWTICLILGLPTAASAAVAQTQANLRAFFIDVDGGQSTLIVTPAGQSLLIDTGWPEHEGRDADRVVAAAKLAGVSRIDYLILTHFHADHSGGVPQLAARIPIGAFIDHGPNREPTDATTAGIDSAYRRVLATGSHGHLVARPGEVLPLRGVEATVVSADDVTIARPLPGAGQANPACAQAVPHPTDRSENRRSVGIVLTFGALRLLDLGDLTSDVDAKLVCPVNLLGRVDVFVVSHHGSAASNSRELVDAVAPRVAIQNNGATKGGSSATWGIVKGSPRLEDLWQLHVSSLSGGHNVPVEFIANADGPDEGYYLELIGHRDGSFAVFNPRTRKTKEYPAR